MFTKRNPISRANSKFKIITCIYMINILAYATLVDVILTTPLICYGTFVMLTFFASIIITAILDIQDEKNLQRSVTSGKSTTSKS